MTKVIWIPGAYDAVILRPVVALDDNLNLSVSR